MNTSLKLHPNNKTQHYAPLWNTDRVSFSQPRDKIQKRLNRISHFFYVCSSLKFLLLGINLYKVRLFNLCRL